METQTELNWVKFSLPLNLVCVVFACACVRAGALICWPACVSWTVWEKFSLKTSNRVYWKGTWMVTDLAWNMYHEWNANLYLKLFKEKKQHIEYAKSCGGANTSNSKTEERKGRPLTLRTVQFHEPAERAVFTFLRTEEEKWMLWVACKDKHERNHQEFFRPFLLCCV